MIEHETDILRILPTFRNLYEQFREHGGKAFRLLGMVAPCRAGENTLFWIELETGETIEAWPEEIFQDAMDKKD